MNSHSRRQKILVIGDSVNYPPAVNDPIDDANSIAAASDAAASTSTFTQQVSALRVAIGNLVGQPQERHLVSLLRRIAPDDSMLARIDELEVESLRADDQDDQDDQHHFDVATSDARVG